MLSLHELQIAFATAVLDGQATSVGVWIHGDGLEPGARVNVYRNNVRQGFLKALALEFPVIQRLVGEEYFRQLAARFQLEHPSRAGDLQSIGAPFAAFLRAEFAGTEYSYLPDIAELEWACQESTIAANAGPLDLTTLRGLSPDSLEGLRFSLHPACHLVHSEFPIVPIWSANQDDQEGTEVIDLDAGAESVLVHRRHDTVEFHQLPLADFTFLKALQQGHTLGDSLQAAQRASPSFDLARALRQFVGLNVFTSVHTT